MKNDPQTKEEREREKEKQKEQEEEEEKKKGERFSSSWWFVASNMWLGTGCWASLRL